MNRRRDNGIKTMSRYQYEVGVKALEWLLLAPLPCKVKSRYAIVRCHDVFEFLGFGGAFALLNESKK